MDLGGSASTPASPLHSPVSRSAGPTDADVEHVYNDWIAQAGEGASILSARHAAMRNTCLGGSSGKELSLVQVDEDIDGSPTSRVEFVAWKSVADRTGRCVVVRDNKIVYS
eukprot:15432198-Alexandrium_andersonii.AAC.1